MADDLLQRAHTWIVGGDTGISSKTIWAHMMGVTKNDRFGNGCPCDPDDLGRCLRLLALIPEWQARIVEMAALSICWARLVKHWDSLAACMAKEVGIGWSKGRSAEKTYGMMRLVLEGDLP